MSLPAKIVRIISWHAPCAACTIKGCVKVGLNLLMFTVHPMKLGATLMSSFLFNTALVLLATTAAIQFCSQAFSLYANETAIYQIFGNQVRLPSGLYVKSYVRQVSRDPSSKHING